MNCRECEELSGAYALEALNDEEHKAMTMHLAACPKCMYVVQQLQETVNFLPFAVPPVNPPPYLKGQIIARIQNSQAVPLSTPLQHYQLPPENRKRRLHKTHTLLAATILLLLISLGGLIIWNIALRQQVDRLSTRTLPPVTYTIHKTDQSAAATGEMIYYPQQQIIVLILRGLPHLSGTHVYQGWLLQGKQARSIGLLNIQNGVATLDFQGSINGYDAAAVSREKGPQASNNTPKGPVVAVGSLKNSVT